jgi:hypothetical protein
MLGADGGVGTGFGAGGVGSGAGDCDAIAGERVGDDAGGWGLGCNHGGGVDALLMGASVLSFFGIAGAGAACCVGAVGAAVGAFGA